MKRTLLLLLARLLRRPLRLDVIERTCIIYTNAGCFRHYI